MTEKIPSTEPYPSNFQELIRNHLYELLVESEFNVQPWNHDNAWEDWQKGRKLIAEALHKDGTILDYGSANGFLLRSLQEWSPHNLNPYGIEREEDRVEAAQRLFPETPEHFLTPKDYEKGPHSFPERFDFVFWNVWDNWELNSSQQIDTLKTLFSKVEEGGRLILGLYSGREANEEKIKRLERLGFQVSGRSDNPEGKETIVWIDKK